ncbi:hypothetical protein [Mucilaginibacter sp.]|uniref:hypothetical protein n=1 Tax=Mucilaginibacter sp. TaxID=1882438 RepID=UPI00261A15FB|nr:hypothetical protein [Mucilaginibacter sp.]MDB5128299.1 hypothetical protein [Mucilaginibacter sp.]
MKKAILSLLIVFICGKVFCQQTPYTLPLPAKRGSEKIPFPISFAPGIPFKGMEELRFTPDWNNASKNDYWSYTFLWFIEGKPQLNNKVLQNYMAEYFNGLYRSNSKIKPVGNFTKAKFQKIKVMKDDQETYQGTISTLNFLTGKPIEFYVKIHARNYPHTNHSALMYELSPKHYTNKVWLKLSEIVKGFEYKN